MLLGGHYRGGVNGSDGAGRPARLRHGGLGAGPAAPGAGRRHRGPHRPAARDRPGGGAQRLQGPRASTCPRACSPTTPPRWSNDPDVDVVVEVIGGIEPARELILDALKARQAGGHGQQGAAGQRRRRAVRRRRGRRASTCCSRRRSAGGIPLVRPLRESLLGEPIDRVMGIVNGTTNYILTQMTEEGAAYAEALAEAQEPRLRRARPHRRRRGLRRRGQGRHPGQHRLRRPGRRRRRLPRGHLRHHRRRHRLRRPLGYVVKLLAIAEQRRRPTAGPSWRCGCTRSMLPDHHPLASVRDSFNAVFVQGAAVGELMFYGRGAGGNPTASAVLGDLIDAAAQPAQGHRSASIGALGEVPDPPDRRARVRLLPAPRRGRPARRAARGGRRVRRPRRVDPLDEQEAALLVDQSAEADLVFITHDALEADVQATLRDLRDLDVVRHVGSVLRVLGRRVGPAREVRQHPRRGARCSSSPTCCSPAWPPTAACTSPRRGRRCPTACCARGRRAATPRSPSRSCGPSSRDRSTATTFAGHGRRRLRHLRPSRRGARCATSAPALWLVELFHGPTLAFKDVALQLVGRLFDHELAARGERVTIVGATSGDTGSAAIEACRDRAAIDIVILHPAGRVSDVQRRQMTTVDVANVHNRRRRGHLRRLPGPGEGAVRRRAVPRPGAACRR